MYNYTCMYIDYTYTYTSSYTFIDILWFVQVQEYAYNYISIYFLKNYISSCNYCSFVLLFVFLTSKWILRIL